MYKLERFEKIGYLLSLAVLIFGFLLFFKDTGEWMGSFFAALISAALVFASTITLKWLFQVFKK